jgi:putative NADPH-quinone reductase
LDDPHFTPSGMRKFFDRVYEAGWNAGYKSSQAAPQAGADIFTTFFGATR